LPIAKSLENYAPAREHYEQRLALAQKNSDRMAEVACRNGLGSTTLALGDLEQARELFDTSLAIFQQIGRRRDGAHCP
jgi:tetratricopeptide (TPR) repeat protein